jgi:hypothetical protein
MQRHFPEERKLRRCALKCMPENALELLSSDYLPFRLYAEHKRGATPVQLAAAFSLSETWVVERIEAARLCIEKQIRVALVN